MTISLPNFPTLTFDQSNPFLTGYAQGQQLIQNQQKAKAQMLANAIAQAQANVAPQMAQAKLAHEQQMAPYIQSQTGINNKDIQWYDAKTRSAIALQGANQGLANAEASMNRFKMAHPGYMVGGNAANMEWLKQNGINLFDNQGQGQGQPPPQQQNVPTLPNQLANSMNQGMGSSNGANDGIIPMFGGNGQFNQPNPKQAILNSIIYGSPYTPSEKAQNAASQDQQKKMADYGNKRLQQLANEAQQAAEANQKLNQLKDAYNKSTFKGWTYVDADTKNILPRILGGLLSIAKKDLSPEQATDILSNEVAGYKFASFPGRGTNKALQFVTGMKPNRSQSDNAFNYTIASNQAMNNLKQEQSRFYQAGMSNGYPPSVLDNLWDKYINDNPISDEKGMIDVNKKPTWKDYLNPKAAQAVMSGQKYTPEKSPVKKITEDDIQFSAKMRGISPEQVRKDAKSKGLL